MIRLLNPRTYPGPGDHQHRGLAYQGVIPMIAGKNLICRRKNAERDRRGGGVLELEADGRPLGVMGRQAVKDVP